MTLQKNFELLSQYNSHMNRRFCEAAAGLDAEELGLDRRAFFGSILGTFNHILVGDTIWLQRFTAHPRSFQSLIPVQFWPRPASLSQCLHTEFSDLALARAEADKVIEALCREATEHDYCQVLAYENTRGQPFRKQFGHLMQHFFNHQTHHRGQLSALLFQAGLDVGVTDLLAVIPDMGGRVNAHRPFKRSCCCPRSGQAHAPLPIDQFVELLPLVVQVVL